MTEEEIGKDVRELSNLLVEVLEEHIAHHRRVHSLYEKAFEQVEGIALKSNPGKAWNANYWLCTVLLDKDWRAVLCGSRCTCSRYMPTIPIMLTGHRNPFLRKGFVFLQAPV